MIKTRRILSDFAPCPIKQGNSKAAEQPSHSYPIQSSQEEKYTHTLKHKTLNGFLENL